jgi:2-C-methyl-D-erythritol 4-phosphate cytidylyltransferase
MGKRMKSETTKQRIQVLGKPIIYYTIKAFLENRHIQSLTLVAHPSEMDILEQEVVNKYFRDELLSLKKTLTITTGGAERYHSVYNGLLALDDDVTHVLIHDGARPLISQKDINQVVEMLEEESAVILGVPQTNTMKLINTEGYIEETVPRNRLISVQTPQGFSKELIMNAYHKGMENPMGITDDAMMVEHFSEAKIKVVTGEYSNIKVTTKEDLVTLETFLKKLYK